MAPISTHHAAAVLPAVRDTPHGETSGMHQFAYTGKDFERIRKLIYQTAGISLNPHKQHMVYSRLARRLRARELHSFRDYLDLIEDGDHQELEAFINALTTNLTSFFREPHHFSILARHLEEQARHRSTLSIWSCAASSGEEPYSIAMTVVELFNSFTPPVRIFASDIDTNALELASQGVYPLERVNSLSQERIRRFFLRGEGRNSGFVRIKPELRKLITFCRKNLLDNDWGFREQFDSIFCRNVMIYFDKETQYNILKKFVPRLQPDGRFFAGHSENFHQATDLLRLCGKTVYQPVVGC